MSGFLVDAAILGFAVGAGFALVENVEYLRALSERGMVLWLVRGFGTAILHGATTAILAILAKGLVDRHPDRALLALVPGYLAAASIHSVYNHHLLPPVLSAAVLLVGLPLLVIAVFERSERRTRDFLGVGLDTDLEVVESIASGQALETRIGHYLRSLKERFPGEVVADMLCLLRIQAELSIRAKGLLLAREAGLEAPVGDDVRDRLTELRYLEHSIGRTGLLAMKPVVRYDARALWQVYLLEEAGRAGSKAPASADVLVVDPDLAPDFGPGWRQNGRHGILAARRPTVGHVDLKRFETPDEVRVFEKGRLAVIRIGGTMLGRAEYEPAGSGPSTWGPASALRSAPSSSRDRSRGNRHRGVRGRAGDRADGGNGVSRARRSARQLGGRRPALRLAPSMGADSYARKQPEVRR